MKVGAPGNYAGAPHDFSMARRTPPVMLICVFPSPERAAHAGFAKSPRIRGSGQRAGVLMGVRCAQEDPVGASS